MTTSHPVDLRSDTTTHPTPAMYEALLKAPLGDDVFGDDPTVAALENEAAQLLRMEAALFMPSGTMANSVAIAVSTSPGDEIVLMDDAHTYLYEGGGSARLWGVHPRPLPGRGGCLDPGELESVIRVDDVHEPRTRLVLLENTHNLQGGIVVTPDEIEEVASVCRRHGLRLHLDGARIFNAAVASGHPACDFVQAVDTVCFCLSKGLSAPVGSLFLGSRDDVKEARRIRKLLGGGLRQAGVLAACGRVALREGIDRLAEDHRRAADLAGAWSELPGVEIWPRPPETNIFLARLPGNDPQRHARFVRRLEGEGVLSLDFGDRGVRFVTHRGIDDLGVERARAAFENAYRQSI